MKSFPSYLFLLSFLLSCKDPSIVPFTIKGDIQHLPHTHMHVYFEDAMLRRHLFSEVRKGHFELKGEVPAEQIYQLVIAYGSGRKEISRQDKYGNHYQEIIDTLYRSAPIYIERGKNYEVLYKDDFEIRSNSEEQQLLSEVEKLKAISQQRTIEARDSLLLKSYLAAARRDHVRYRMHRSAADTVAFIFENLLQEQYHHWMKTHPSSTITPYLILQAKDYPSKRGFYLEILEQLDSRAAKHPYTRQAKKALTP